ncbi:hypothetical protein HF263_12960 [Rhizobium leguminosarum]|jgi:quercetin dioxygenase-like cupin family protein|nr:hypothetical protein [Rhizobium leguminosarum]MBY2988034.1 hypothetical protein [Rhizobium leguminosarum]MBY2993455.1 hypothetical protein [Rhizobium leguminosarum]MBY3056968.1 hypothetical protein [Rhizobium leguminosarum]
MLKGKALMRIWSEKCEVGPGDLIYIPPNAVHSISPNGNSRCGLLHSRRVSFSCPRFYR